MHGGRTNQVCSIKALVIKRLACCSRCKNWRKSLKANVKSEGFRQHSAYSYSLPSISPSTETAAASHGKFRNATFMDCVVPANRHPRRWHSEVTVTTDELQSCAVSQHGKNDIFDNLDLLYKANNSIWWNQHKIWRSFFLYSIVEKLQLYLQ